MTFRDYLIITVSKEDFEIVEFAKNKILATYPGISKIEIKVADNFKKGDVEIERFVKVLTHLFLTKLRS